MPDLLMGERGLTLVRRDEGNGVALQDRPDSEPFLLEQSVQVGRQQRGGTADAHRDIEGELRAGGVRRGGKRNNRQGNSCPRRKVAREGTPYDGDIDRIGRDSVDDPSLRIRFPVVAEDRETYDVVNDASGREGLNRRRV